MKILLEWIIYELLTKKGGQLIIAVRLICSEWLKSHSFILSLFTRFPEPS